MKDINHLNIIKMIDFKEDSDYNYCIYDYCNGGNLSVYLKYLKENNKSFSEGEAQYIIKQLVEAVKYLHNKRIVHRDIKPENILIYYDSEEDLLKKNIIKAKIKLAGFYVSSPLEKGKFLDTMVGTFGYMSPEIISCNLYNEKTDLWNLGIVFSELLPFFQNISKEANSFINSTLQFDPEKRINADELLKHEFLIKDAKTFSFQK